MAVAFDAVSEFSGTADPTEGTHTPSGTPRGVIVLIGQCDIDTDIVVGVTYGGVAMTRVATIGDASPGLRSYAYRLLSSIPTGAQTVSVDRNQATSLLNVVTITVTAGADTEIIDSDTLNINQADPQITLQYGGRTALAVAMNASGLNAFTSVVELGTCTRIHDHDCGQEVTYAARQTTPGSSDFTIGWTVSADNNSMVALAISEVVGGGGSTQPPRSMHQFRLRRSK